ncbi:hypothetical protein Lser_V15G19456 [Lactuca serriola]
MQLQAVHRPTPHPNPNRVLGSPSLRGLISEMAGRKVSCTYYPADFDPAKIPRRIRANKQKQEFKLAVMMLPVSIRCKTCGEETHRGTRFGTRLEEIQEETDLEMMVMRFYLKCPKCSQEIKIKTDPQNLDYIVESGADRLID